MTAASTTDDALSPLVPAARDGSVDARDELLGHVRGLAHRYCRARLGGLPGGFATADDAAQEVCLAVVAALPDYEDRGLPFGAWVYGIAARKVVDARRRAAAAPVCVADPVDPRGPEAPDPLDHVLAVERSARMSRLLETLPAQQREVLVLRVAVGLSAAEAAQILGTTSAAVRVAQHRALRSLRNHLTVGDAAAAERRAS